MTDLRALLILALGAVLAPASGALALAAAELAAAELAADGGGWTVAQAVDEIDRLVVLGKARGPLEKRLPGIQAWVERVESSGIDLGEQAYVLAFPLYLIAKRERGPSAEPTESIKCLGDHVVAHGGLPESARKYTGWIDRILPAAQAMALKDHEYDRVRALVKALAAHGSRGPYSAYSRLARDLVGRDFLDDQALLVDVMEMALADNSMSDTRKVTLMKYVFGGGEDPLRDPPAQRRKVAPRGGIAFVPFSGPGLDGSTIAVDDFKGKVLLIDFWATWCGPCIREMPNVVRAHDKYREQGFAILGVSLDRKNQAGRLRSVMEKHGITWPQIYDGGYWRAEAAVLNNVRRIPATFLLDRSGRVRYKGLRGPALDRRIKQLLAEPALDTEPPLSNPR